MASGSFRDPISPADLILLDRIGDEVFTTVGLPAHPSRRRRKEVAPEVPMTVEREVKRDQVWARVFLMGPTGSGKSRASFELASRLFGGDLPIVLINTEPNRGKLYADRFTLAGLIDLTEDYHPDRFIEALDVAESIAPGGVIILDSATHEWYGTNGITQLAHRFSDWGKARPLHQKFVDRLTICQAHLIVCCRAKMKYDQSEIDDNGRKKQVVTMLGVGPMQDADFQYEFNLVGMFDQKSHDVEWSGHVDSLVDTTSNLADDADRVADLFTAWLSEGEAPPPLPPAAEQGAVDELVGLLLEDGHAQELIDSRIAEVRRLHRGVLTADWVAETSAKAVDRLAKKAGAKPEPADTVAAP